MREATYQIGEQTKAKIYEISKKLFYENGYKKTTYSDISKEADVNRALIPYYYENKSKLAYLIFKELDHKLAVFCKEATDSFGDEISIAFYMFSFYRMLKNSNISKFLSEFYSDSTFDEQIVEGEIHFFKSISEHKRSMSDTELTILAQMDYGIEKEITSMCYHHPEVDVDSMTIMELHMILSYFGYSRNKVNEFATTTLGLLDKYEFTILTDFDFNITEK